MAPTAQGHASNGMEQVRARLLTSLHVGRLQPGDRVPSVRRLADLTGFNPKTVHRAVTILAREGFLDVRPGSGTYVRVRHAGGAEVTENHDLLSTVNRMRGMASALGLAPAVFSDFVQAALGDGLRRLPVVVVECNHEQSALISEDLARGLGVTPVRLLLPDVLREPQRARRVAWTVVTTDCHFSEVAEALAPIGLSVHCVALGSSFPLEIARIAKVEPVVLLVRDAAFGPVFTRLLQNLEVPSRAIERIRIAEVSRAAATLSQADPATRVFVSPTVRDVVDRTVVGRFRPVQGAWRVRRELLDRLRAELALELAVRRGRESVGR